MAHTGRATGPEGEGRRFRDLVHYSKEESSFGIAQLSLKVPDK